MALIMTLSLNVSSAAAADDGVRFPYEKPTDKSAVTTRYADVSREEELDAFEPKVRDSRQLDPVMFEAWAKSYLATDPRSASRSPPSVRVPTGMFAALERNRRQLYRETEAFLEGGDESNS